MRAWGSGPSKLRERPPASRSNPHADDFDPAPASDHAVDGRRREPSVDQLDQQLGLEPVSQHDRLGAAVDGCLKQFERPATGGRRAAFAATCRHRSRAYPHTHWKTNPYDSNPFLFSAKRRDQGGHKEAPYTCCPYLGLAFSVNANAISLAAFTTSVSSKRPKRPGLV